MALKKAVEYLEKCYLLATEIGPLFLPYQLPCQIKPNSFVHLFLCYVVAKTSVQAKRSDSE